MAGARSAAGLGRYAAAVRLSVRRLTAARRALPDFLVIGAQKAGTTSLYAYLTAHPDVLAATRKEVHYFDINFERGERWYRSMFPLQRALHAAGTARRLTGEASPYYLFHPLAAQRAAQCVPEARVIAVLRDPVERAWSHYQHEVAAGREPLSFEKALAAESDRLAGADEALRAGHASRQQREAHRYHSYFARGRYADQLRTWLAHYPRSAVLVLDAAQLFGTPEQAWRRTIEFLELRQPATAPRFVAHNPGSGAQLDPVLRAELTDRYAAANADLAALLGMQFDW